MRSSTKLQICPNVLSRKFLKYDLELSNSLSNTTDKIISMKLVDFFWKRFAVLVAFTIFRKVIECAIFTKWSTATMIELVSLCVDATIKPNQTEPCIPINWGRIYEFFFCHWALSRATYSLRLSRLISLCTTTFNINLGLLLPSTGLR